MEERGLEVVRKAARGVAAAEAFMLTFYDIAHFFDDVLDRDADIGEASIYKALWQAMVELPRNGFYKAHFNELNPIVCQGILCWRTANTLERGTDEDGRRFAYVLRSAYLDVVTHTALILGGPEFAAEVALDLKRWAANESYATYRRELPAG